MTDYWLPPDQVATTGWPVVGERAPAASAPAAEGWTLEIGGEVTTPRTLDWTALQALPQRALVMDVHCVTGWSHRAMRFLGTPLAELLDPTPAARFVRFEAWSQRRHDVSLPLEIAQSQSWLVHADADGPLPPAHGGPLRVVTPGRYFYKSLKWVRRIELLTDDQLGYWERTDGYHNGADPWPGDQRYLTGNLTGAALERFKGATRFRRWHHKTIRRAPLAGWAPLTTDLGPLALKGCDLRGARLLSASLPGANFSLSDLRGADLRGADLRGADLEGANLAGADLRDADLRDAALTATRFFDDEREARVEGLRLDGALGLLEGARAWLAARGLTA